MGLNKKIPGSVRKDVQLLLVTDTPKVIQKDAYFLHNGLPEI